jgi:hypothetical protein
VDELASNLNTMLGLILGQLQPVNRRIGIHVHRLALVSEAALVLQAYLDKRPRAAQTG